MRWFRLLSFAGLTAALLAGFLFCRKKKEYAAGLNLALTQLIFGGMTFPFVIAEPWTGKGMTETVEWLEWGLWSVASFMMLTVGIIGTVVSVASLVKARRLE